MTDCRAVLESLHDALDGRLGAADRTALDAHVALCPGCARAAADLRRLRAALRALPPAPAPAGFREDVLARVVEEPVAAPGGRLLSWPRLVFPAAAAAALLVGAAILANRSDETTVAAARGKEERNSWVERDSVGSPGFTTDSVLDAAEARKLRDGPGAAAVPATEAAPATAPGAAVPGAPAAAEPTGPAPAPAREDAPASGGAFGRKKGDAGATSRGESKDAVREDAASDEKSEAKSAPRTRVVVFRTDDEARAFLAALAPPADAREQAQDAEKQTTKPGAPARSRGGSGGGTGGSVGGARAAATAPVVEPHVAARVQVRGDAWIEAAAKARGRVVEVSGDEVASLDRGDPARFVAVRDVVRRIVADEGSGALGAERADGSPQPGGPAERAHPQGGGPAASAPPTDKGAPAAGARAADSKNPTPSADLDDEAAGEAILVVVVPDAPPPAGAR